jgi:hypothetical protein
MDRESATPASDTAYSYPSASPSADPSAPPPSTSASAPSESTVGARTVRSVPGGGARRATASPRDPERRPVEVGALPLGLKTPVW